MSRSLLLFPTQVNIAMRCRIVNRNLRRVCGNLHVSESALAVGENLRRLREERGLTQAALARRAGIDRSHVLRIEDGTFKHPRPQNLEKLARALNVEVDELTGRSVIRQITPYDSNPKYRELIDALEEADEDDRAEILRHTIWAAHRANRKQSAAPTGDFGGEQSAASPPPPPPLRPSADAGYVIPGSERKRKTGEPIAPKPKV